jgi:hypothetical protein
VFDGIGDGVESCALVAVLRGERGSRKAKQNPNIYTEFDEGTEGAEKTGALL